MYFMDEDKTQAQQIKAYFDKLDRKWGKLTENHAGMPNIGSEHIRRQLTIALDNTERLYKMGSYMDVNMTIPTTVGVIWRYAS